MRSFLTHSSPWGKQAAFLLLFLLVLSTLYPTALWAQTATGRISGTVTDKAGQSLPGAVVYISSTKQGTSANADGSFSLGPVADGEYELTISYVGYESTKVAAKVTGGKATSLRVTLETAGTKLEDVVVTGVFDRRTALTSSIAISTLSSQQIEVQTPVSTAALLRNVSGVYVNSANGEIGNTVYSRGVSASSSNSLGSQNGYYYVSLQ
ncbi:MAG: hypothetical protein EOO62_30880, partial [Hymenobacter sp.]